MFIFCFSITNFQNSQDSLVISRPGQTKPFRPMIVTLPFSPEMMPTSRHHNFTLHVEPQEEMVDDKQDPEATNADKADPRCKCIYYLSIYLLLMPKTINTMSLIKHNIYLLNPWLSNLTPLELKIIL